MVFQIVYGPTTNPYKVYFNFVPHGTVTRYPQRSILVPFPSRANVFRSLLYVDRCLLFRSCRPSSRVFLVPFGSVGRPCANACWCSVSLRARLACARLLRAVPGQLGLDTMHSVVVRCARVVGRFVHAPFRLGASDVRFGFVVRFFASARHAGAHVPGGSTLGSVAILLKAQDILLKPVLLKPTMESPAPTEIDPPTSPISVHSSPARPEVPASQAPAVNDTSDDESDPDLPASVRPYKHWTNMKARVRLCLEGGFHEYHELRFNLAPPGADWQPHLDRVVNEGLNLRGVTHFKFGITYTPHKRFWDDDYKSLRLMVVSLTTENTDLTADAEKKAIGRYRYIDYRCKNKAPGGESAHHYVSPHFLYVVFGTHAQFRKRSRSE